MRKSQKKQAEGFLGLLAQAHNEFRLAIEQKKTSVALSLLADCQDGAIALGDFIEKAEGEACKTIHILEEYCELVYQIHEEITQEALACEKQFVNEKQSINRKQYADGKQNANGNHHIDGNKIYKSLCRMLHNIENSIQNDIKVRLEAVFLPYKASMWDSLESIWKAAEEDTDCDAYVIPIPYYDKKPDGSFGEIHYEGSQYPEYVPVTWYEDYDFEKRKPDMIFIHNPYDECNYVTSVSPFFYSKNLKKFTDKLVYVPYFILGEVEPENEEAVKGIAHFCTVPGVLYADKVIVQSEKMRQIYIKVMTNYMAGHQGYGKQYWEEKILGLGSPKVDKVLSTRKEELEIPEAWKKVIEKPDGSWKKIVFYNTSVTALLNHNEKMLEKIQNVFHVFQENRDEVALLWRPHPLMKATLESMRPLLWNEYQKIEEQYREAAWGIFDDSADMERAIMLSDVYYGDASSIVQLYQKTGKPIMIQHIEILQGSDSN